MSTGPAERGLPVPIRHAVFFAAVVAGALLVAALPAAGGEPPEAVAQCLECHSDPSLTLSFDDGSEMSLTVDAADLAASVHGADLVCTDCHKAYDNGDHPSGRTFPSRRDYARSTYEVCKGCHFDTYTRNLESVHFAQLEKGNKAAPVCADCHGAHRIVDPQAQKAAMSQTCARCHQPIVEKYALSVHGKALLADGNPDVPACADCHTAHSIEDPRTAKFRMRSPEICIGCHGDARRMEKYGIPTEVASSYLGDFHGVTASLSREGKVDERHLVVTCIDCHGVHDIAALKSMSPVVMKEKVQEVCARCHQTAAKDFPAAWLSHYRPTLASAPLVWLIRVAYMVFIPFMIIGLGLQVLLHLYRVAVRR